ncbi:hypothetical protein GCM10010967_18890 [Dyadobacter beijingensis]|uniref:Lipoprotein n=1 Tax=Dyadobacter beijingensis TaxID=365489 RepID=A0ABQ2HN79_9BACT|nr:hypothetical protein [Dyadobacter beijingensis]GGM86741.1 hypothetical protein GCM10010967_18890 [Dyadobacter beijingensis]
MQARLISILLLATVTFTACQKEAADPLTTGPEPVPYRIEKDSIETGSFLGIAIGDEAAAVYPKIQALQLSKGVTAMNVVGNIFSDLDQLRDRIPLYEYILLDQNRGTDTGVQITIKGTSVSAIYLNSGKKLNQWPEKEKASASVQTGEHVNALFGKFTSIRKNKTYSSKFERIFLMTKNLATAYDPAMTQSPQWYFGYATGPETSEQIQVHFENGKVKKIRIDHYSQY